VHRSSRISLRRLEVLFGFPLQLMPSGTEKQTGRIFQEELPMTTRPLSVAAPVAAGISILCALALLTGWLVLSGAPFALAIPANAAFVAASVALLIHRPRRSR
jgi:uncharacterized membrane protein YphA (DoxX/SURF4 family)